MAGFVLQQIYNVIRGFSYHFCIIGTLLEYFKFVSLYMFAPLTFIGGFLLHYIYLTVMSCFAG